jgi:hypothetical protein
MGTLVKGVIFGIIGAVIFVPVVLFLAVLGIPLFIAALAVIGALLAVPLIVVAAISLPFIALAGIVLVAIAATILVAAKVAIFVVLPIALVALAIGWLIRTSHARRMELSS